MSITQLMAPRIEEHVRDDRGPRRTLIVTMLITAVGNGVYMTAGVLYFTRSVHLPAQEVGLGFSVAGVVSLGTSVLIGHLSDRLGAREVYSATLLLGGIAMAAFSLTDSFWPFVLIACLCGATRSALPAASGPIVRHYGGARPQALRARLRTVGNLGVSCGALLAGLAVEDDTRAAYLAAIFITSVCYIVCAAMMRTIPPLAPEPVDDRQPRWIALRDRPYVTLTGLVGVMSIHYRVLSVAFPLWLVTETSAPRWLVTVSVLVNTGIVVAFQVRISKGVDSTARAGGALRRAGVAFLLACALIAAAAHVAAWPAVCLLCAAVVVYTVGELWHAAAGMEISFELADPRAQGQYLGVFGMGMGIADSVGPALLVALCIGWGVSGWLTVGAFFTVMGMISPAVVRWAERKGGHARAVPTPTGPPGRLRAAAGRTTTEEQ